MKVDFHTHILPKIDDGCQSKEEGAKMLEQLKAQGIEAVVLTPHFYIDDFDSFQQGLDIFTANKSHAYRELAGLYNQNTMPKLIQGCECTMWKGMSEQDLTPLCIENTNLILCEMPYRYQSYITDELEELAVNGFVPVIAHIDRYLNLYEGKQLYDIYNLKYALFQINIPSLSKLKTRMEMCRLAKLGKEFILGSDCHNLNSRPPVINPSILNKGSVKKHILPSVIKNESILNGII